MNNNLFVRCAVGGKALAAVIFALSISTNVVKAESSPLSLPISSLVTPTLIDSVRDWSTTPVVLKALEGRNEKSGALEQSKINQLDQQWRAETQSEDQPLITSILANPLSSYLTQIQANALGVYSEIFVMDRNGLNTGQSAITSDYWQGDEAKFQKTFGVGAREVFLDDAEFHETTGTWRAQLNMTISKRSGEAVGAITVELNLTELERRVKANVPASF